MFEKDQQTIANMLDYANASQSKYVNFSMATTVSELQVETAQMTPEQEEALFGTHIRDAVKVLKDWMQAKN